MTSKWVLRPTAAYQEPCLIVTVGMYLGRIGPISMAFFLTGGKKNDSGVHYAEGDFYIG